MSKIKQLLFRYNPWWDGDFLLSGIIKRPILFKKLAELHLLKDTILLTGLRRVGKTTLMRMMIKELATDIDQARHLFYLSLDDYGLKGMALSDIVDEFRAIHKFSHSEQLTLFLDEVTALPDFEIQLKNLYDMGGVKIYAASSSASVLREGGGYLTGRKRFFPVPPLDFHEYLHFKQIKISPADGHLFKEYFEDYMRTGGIPEFVLTGDVAYLRELVDDIICKDIAAVHNIKSLGMLRDFFMLLMERAGKSVSVNKMARIMQISPDTSRRFLDLFEKSFLISLVSRATKLNESLRSPKKLYSVDLGIRVLFTGYRDLGSLFENYIFNLISSKAPRFILEDGIELDFITDDGLLIEAKYYDAMWPKQQLLFDAYPAKDKLVIDSVEALTLFDSTDDEIIRATCREEYDDYLFAASKLPNLGRTPGMVVHGGA
ncbi:MAG: ATP-binding protein [Victivallaceae bacterium]|nr:ATP-binding protein [Victivallaceae bacterium]